MSWDLTNRILPQKLRTLRTTGLNLGQHTSNICMCMYLCMCAYAYMYTYVLIRFGHIGALDYIHMQLAGNVFMLGSLSPRVDN